MALCEDAADMPQSSPPPIEASQLFRGLAPEAVAEALRAAVRRPLAAGEVLFLEGEPVEALFVVESGVLRLVQHTADGQEVIVRTLGAGEIVAAVALLDKRSYPVSAIGQTACRMLSWPRDRILALAARHPLLRANALGAIADRMQDSLSRIRELAKETVAQRVARSLVRLVRDHGRAVPEGSLIDQPLSRQELADMAGVSMYTASRLLAAWSREGIVDSSRRRIVVRSSARLADIASGDDAQR